RQVLMRDPSEAAIAAQARAAGMLTLRAAAIEKARRGETTFEEAIRVTHADHSGGHSCPACDRAVGPDMVACPGCGTPRARGQCHGCSPNLDPDWRVCPWCRTPAGDGASAGAGVGDVPQARRPR